MLYTFSYTTYALNLTYSFLDVAGSHDFEVYILPTNFVFCFTMIIDCYEIFLVKYGTHPNLAELLASFIFQS